MRRRCHDANTGIPGPGAKQGAPADARCGDPRDARDAGGALGPDEARHLDAQLPHEIQLYLRGAAPPMPESFSSDEFLERVCAREGIDLPESTFHARAVIDVRSEAVSQGEIADVLDRLPDDYRRLLAGSEGKMPRP
jgi:hypothetical protein